MRTKIEFILSLMLSVALVLVIHFADQLGMQWYLLVTVPLFMIGAIMFHCFKNHDRLQKQNSELKKLVTAVSELKDKYHKENRGLVVESKTHEVMYNELNAIRKTLTKAAIWAVIDKKEKITFVNNYFCEISGYAKSELIGKHHSLSNEGLYEDSFWKDILEKVRAGNPWRGEIQSKRKDGSVYWTDTLIGPIMNSDSEFESYLTLKFDITEKKAMETELTRTHEELKVAKAKVDETNRTKDKLFSIVAHDLRSPLAALDGVLELMALGSLTNNEIQMVSGRLGENLAKVNELLNNLLQWSRNQLNGITVKPARLNIKALVANSAALLKDVYAKKNIIIVNRIPAGEYVMGDKIMISTVIRNLMVNAIKFSKSDGTITINSHHEENRVVISVSDSGVGIDYSIQEKLFKDISITQKGTSGEIGSGIGLHICKDFVELNKGSLNFESTPGKGSTFYFDLPVFHKLQEVIS